MYLALDVIFGIETVSNDMKEKSIRALKVKVFNCKNEYLFTI